jgi:hypothetical protein
MTRTYHVTAGEILAEARVLLQDDRSDMGYRTPDTTLYGYLNDALGAMLSIAPGLFGRTAPLTCVPGYLQPLDFDRAAGLLNVVGMREVDEPALTEFAPGWTAGTPAAPIEWMRVKGEPLRFMTYPPAVGGETLAVRYLRAHDVVAAEADPVQVPENYKPALVEYVVGRTEIQDDEHVNTNRAGQLLERFAASVKALA